MIGHPPSRATLEKRPAFWAFERLDTFRRRILQRADSTSGAPHPQYVRQSGGPRGVVALPRSLASCLRSRGKRNLCNDRVKPTKRAEVGGVSEALGAIGLFQREEPIVRHQARALRCIVEEFTRPGVPALVKVDNRVGSLRVPCLGRRCSGCNQRNYDGNGNRTESRYDSTPELWTISYHSKRPQHALFVHERTFCIYKNVLLGICRADFYPLGNCVFPKGSFGLQRFCQLR